MADLECPLELCNSKVLGLEGYVWEPGIPQACHECFRNLGKIISEQFFDEDVDPDPDADGYYCLGIKATGEYDRLAVEDIGQDDSDSTEGALTSRTTYEFECPRSNPPAIRWIIR